MYKQTEMLNSDSKKAMSTVCEIQI